MRGNHDPLRDSRHELAHALLRRLRRHALLVAARRAVHERVGQRPSRSRTTCDRKNPFTNAVPPPRAVPPARCRARRHRADHPIGVAAHEVRHGSVDRTHQLERLIRQRTPLQVAAEHDRVEAARRRPRPGRPRALPRCHARRAEPRRASALRAADDRELVLGVTNALLDLPAVSRRLARLDLGRAPLLRGLELLARARTSSMSSALTASSTSAIARSCSTSKKPGPVANSSTSFCETCTRVEPAFSVAISGAWRASTPISPAAPGTMIISASPS